MSSTKGTISQTSPLVLPQHTEQETLNVVVFWFEVPLSRRFLVPSNYVRALPNLHYFLILSLSENIINVKGGLCYFFCLPKPIIPLAQRSLHISNRGSLQPYFFYRQLLSK